MMKAAYCALAIGFAMPVFAQDVQITSDLMHVDATISGKAYQFVRSQDQAAHIDPAYALTSRACPPNCIAPMQSAPGVVSLGELELLSILRGDISEGSALLIDVRAPKQFALGHIPAAVNMPAATIQADNPFRNEILQALGATEADGQWRFDNVLTLVLYDDGPWVDEAGQVVRDLLSVGYPAERIKYYRGGLQMWLLFGFNTISS